MRTKDNSGLKI